ncbi:MAG: glycosyltransferase family 2 protein [Bryobacterales bacterium]|nr:glycosyltransferase family 2 protein [Bryobacterales bacterium]
MTDVSVVIVTYQSADVIGRCVASCVGKAREVIVVDNASSDGTADVVRGLAGARLLANGENRGFAGGVNQGVKAAASDVILLLNPDAELLEGLDMLREAAQRYGASAGRLTDAAGAYQKGFGVRRFPTPMSLSLEVLGLNRLFPGNRWNRRYRCLDLKEDEAGLVEQPAGAFLAFRRSIWEQLGGFDERFHPAWFEDVDFCKRLLDNGFSIRYEPGATARHEGGHSARQLDWSTRERYWYGSLLKYAGKQFPRAGSAVVSLAVLAGMLPRVMMGMIRFRSMDVVLTYAMVIRLAGRTLVHGGGGGQSPSTKNTQASIHGL